MEDQLAQRPSRRAAATAAMQRTRECQAQLQERDGSASDEGDGPNGDSRDDRCVAWHMALSQTACMCNVPDCIPSRMLQSFMLWAA